MESRMGRDRIFFLCFALLSLVDNSYGYIAYMPSSLGVTDDPCGPTLDGMRAAGETGLPNSPYIPPPAPGQVPNYNSAHGNVYDYTGGSTQPGYSNGHGSANQGSGNVYSVYGGRTQDVAGQYPNNANSQLPASRSQGVNPSPADPTPTGRRISAPADPPINSPSVRYRVTGEVQRKTPGIRQRRVKRQMFGGAMGAGAMGPMGGGYSPHQAAMLDYDPPEYPYAQPMAGGMGQGYMHNYGAVGAGTLGTGTAGVGQPYGTGMVLDLPDLPLGFTGPITPQVAAMYDVDVPPGGFAHPAAGGPQYGPNQPQMGPSVGSNMQPPISDPTGGYYNAGLNVAPPDPYSHRRNNVQGQIQIQPGRIGVRPQPNIRSRVGSASPGARNFNPELHRVHRPRGHPPPTDHIAIDRNPPVLIQPGRTDVNPHRNIPPRDGPLTSVGQPIEPKIFASEQRFNVQAKPAKPTYGVGTIPLSGTSNDTAISRSQNPASRQQQSISVDLAQPRNISERRRQGHSNPNLQTAANRQSSQRVASRDRNPRPALPVVPSIAAANKTTESNNTKVHSSRHTQVKSQSPSLAKSVPAPTGGRSLPQGTSTSLRSNYRTVTNTGRFDLNATSNSSILDTGPRTVNASKTRTPSSITNPGPIDIKTIPVNSHQDSANGKYPPASSLQDPTAMVKSETTITGASLISGAPRGSVAVGRSGGRNVPTQQASSSLQTGNIGQSSNPGASAISVPSSNSGIKRGPVVAVDSGTSTRAQTGSVSGKATDPVAQNQVPVAQGPVDPYDPYAQNYYDPYDYSNQWYQDPYYQDPYMSSWNPVYYNFWDQLFGFPLGFGWGGYNSQTSSANEQSGYTSNQWSGGQAQSSSPTGSLPPTDQIANNAPFDQFNSGSPKQASVQTQAQVKVNPGGNPIQSQSQRFSANLPNAQPEAAFPGGQESPSIFFSPQDPYAQVGAGPSSSTNNAANADLYAPHSSYAGYPQDPYADYPQNSAYSQNSAYPQDPNYAQNAYSGNAQPSASDPYANVDIYAVPQEPRNCYCELASECVRDAAVAGSHYNGQCDGTGNFVCCCRR